MNCGTCGEPIPVPPGRTVVPPARRYCGRPCYDIARRMLPIRERFFRHVKQSDGCWEWTGARYRNGYGAFGVTRSKMSLAHRFAWRLHAGPIPEGMFVLHRCDNRLCVRPLHLFLGTQADNMRDMAAKGRGGKSRSPGESNVNARLTESDVRSIRERRAAGEMAATLAAEFGVSRPLISYICNGKAWRHVA